MINTKNENIVKIAVNKSLLKEFLVDSQRTVYLKNGSEFQIQIFNPFTSTIGALISINGNEMPNMLVLKPGQRIWLERYLNEARKFLFETYEVNDSKQVRDAIANNGVVTVKFYAEKQKQYFTINTSPVWYEYNEYHNYKLGNINSNVSTCLYSDTLTASAASAATSVTQNDIDLSTAINTSASYNSTKSTSASYGKVRSKSIETGRIEKGNYSNQKFATTNIEFEPYSFNTETIHILPQSRKPVHANELKKMYCVNCGRKLNTKYKFCPYCGTKCEF